MIEIIGNDVFIGEMAITMDALRGAGTMVAVTTATIVGLILFYNVILGK
jgi:hypothetical protein